MTGVADLVRALDADKINRAVSVDFLRRSEQLRLWIGPVERLLAAGILLTGGGAAALLARVASVENLGVSLTACWHHMHNVSRHPERGSTMAPRKRLSIVKPHRTYFAEWREFSRPDLSQAGVGRLVGMDHSSVGRLEKGKIPYDQWWLENSGADLSLRTLGSESRAILGLRRLFAAMLS